VLREFGGYDCTMEEAPAAMRSRAERYRDQVRLLMTREAFAALEERRKVLPASPEYDADFWHGALKALTAK
jgi:hypothetical protein